MDVKHKTLADVRQTIRGEIANEQLFMEQAKKGNSGITSPAIRSMATHKAQAHIDAYKAVLMWLSDLEM